MTIACIIAWYVSIFCRTDIDAFLHSNDSDFHATVAFLSRCDSSCNMSNDLSMMIPRYSTCVAVGTGVLSRKRTREFCRSGMCLVFVLLIVRPYVAAAISSSFKYRKVSGKSLRQDFLCIF